MSKLMAMTLGTSIVVMAIPALAAPLDWAPPRSDPSAVTGHDGRVIGRDPDQSIRSMLQRDQYDER